MRTLRKSETHWASPTLEADKKPSRENLKKANMQPKTSASSKEAKKMLTLSLALCDNK